MTSLRSWDLQIDPIVFRALKRIPRNYAKTLMGVIRLLPSNPYFGDIQKMKDEENVWRRRVGPYRIFFRIKISEKVILVFCLERRGSKTY